MPCVINAAIKTFVSRMSRITGYSAAGAAGPASLRTAAQASSMAACRSSELTSALRAFTPLHSLIEHSPAHRILNELGQVPLAHALGTQVGPQGQIGLTRDRDGQTGGLVGEHP